MGITFTTTKKLNVEPLHNEISSDNPTVYFRMDDSGVPLTDEQGCSTNTFETGSLTYGLNGRFKKAVQSNGGYIRGEVCTGSLQSPQLLNSFEFIVKRNGPPSSNDEYICGNYRNIGIGVEQTTGNLQVFYEGGAGATTSVIVSPFNICDNNWHHCIVTTNGSDDWDAYVDGIQYNFPAQAGQIDTGFIGYGVYLFVRGNFLGTPTTEIFNSGLISMYAFYRNKTLTSTQAADHYAAYQKI